MLKFLIVIGCKVSGSCARSSTAPPDARREGRFDASGRASPRIQHATARRHSHLRRLFPTRSASRLDRHGATRPADDGAAARSADWAAGAFGKRTPTSKPPAASARTAMKSSAYDGDPDRSVTYPMT